MESMSKDLCSLPKSLSYIPNDSFIIYMDKSLKWVSNLCLLIRVSGVEVDCSIPLEFIGWMHRSVVVLCLGNIIDMSKRVGCDTAMCVSWQCRMKLRFFVRNMSEDDVRNITGKPSDI